MPDPKFYNNRSVHTSPAKVPLFSHSLALWYFDSDSDHYQGITANWEYGSIHCSDITGKLLLSKFPKNKEHIKVLPYKTWVKLSTEEQSAEIQVFDSNHMAGSIMILIKIESKFYFHTGDMRFNRKLAENLA